MTTTSRQFAARLLATTLVAGLSAALSPASAAPVISPLAVDLPAASYAADAAAGGSSAESVFNGGYWNAGSHGWHWVQADMGQVQTLSEVRLTVDVLPATVTEQWVFLSDSWIGSGWSDGSHTAVASRSGYTTKYETFDLLFDTAASGRYLLVASHGGASWTALGDGAVRSDWVDPVAQAGAGGGAGAGGSVPEPGSAALVLLALGGLGASRWQRRCPA